MDKLEALNDEIRKLREKLDCAMLAKNQQTCYEISRQMDALIEQYIEQKKQMEHVSPPSTTGGE